MPWSMPLPPMQPTQEDIEMHRKSERMIEALEKEKERQRLRDRFAAAALTGMLNTHAVYHKEPPALAVMAFAAADAMLRVRDSRTADTTNHDAATAATATEKPASSAACHSVGTDKAEPLTGNGGTGDTPVTKPMPKAPSGSGSVTPVPYSRTDENRVDSLTKRDATQPRNGALDEPVAWAVVCGDCVDSLFAGRDEAVEWAYGIIPPPHIVPLYRSRLTDAEREAVETATAGGVGHVYARRAATLRGLLERCATGSE